MTDRNIALGLLVQPLVAAVVGPALVLIRGDRTFKLETLLAFDIELAIVAVIASVIALPVVLWLRDRGAITFWKVLGAGIVLGNIPGALIGLGAHFNPAGGTAPVAVYIGAIGGGSCFGLAGAGVFWLIAGHRPAERELPRQ